MHEYQKGPPNRWDEQRYGKVPEQRLVEGHAQHYKEGEHRGNCCYQANGEIPAFIEVSKDIPNPPSAA